MIGREIPLALVLEGGERAAGGVRHLRPRIAAQDQRALQKRTTRPLQRPAAGSHHGDGGGTRRAGTASPFTPRSFGPFVHSFGPFIWSNSFGPFIWSNSFGPIHLVHSFGPIHLVHSFGPFHSHVWDLVSVAFIHASCCANE